MKRCRGLGRTGRGGDRRGRIGLGAALLALGLGGCEVSGENLSGALRSVERQFAALTTDNPTVALPPAELPDYRVGDSFVYSDGRVETVTAVEGDIVDWRSDGGLTYRGARDFTTPRLAWRSKRLTGERGILWQSGDIWPLEAGDRRRIRVREQITYADGRPTVDRVREWSCRVEGGRRLEVQLGSFAVYEIACTRFGSKRAVATRRWYFAPELGHFVRYEYTNHVRARTDRRDLVAIRPAAARLSSEAAERQQAARQAALEQHDDGAARPWQASGIAGSVMPVASFRDKAGRYCRSYLESLQLDGTLRTWPDLACRAPDGAWRPFEAGMTG